MALASSRLTLATCLAALGLFTACGDDGAGTGGGDSTSSSPAATSTVSTGTGECLGVVEDGVCVGKCDAATTCSVGNICVGNRCALPCEGAVDCYPGTSCQDSTDDAGAAVKACLPSGKAAILGQNCYFGNECDTWSVCPDGTACGASVCGGGACTDGKCPDGTACTPQTCDAAACRAPRCYGAVPDAVQSPSASTFCTQDDCTADADCVQGMYCAKTRDWHEVCGTDLPTFRPEEGDCIDPADFNTDGKTFEIGTITLLRNTCLPREQCAPCSTDLDCSGIAGQVCAQLGGESRCASQCVADVDCGREATCEPDPAHAGMNVCTPKYGSCVGEGEFCGPCLTDLDCGGPESPFVCDVVSMFYDALAPQTPSEVGAQRGCFDLTFPDACPDGTDAECPLAPGGVLRGECLNGSDGYAPSDDLYERCFVPLSDFSLRFQCW